MKMQWRKIWLGCMGLALFEVSVQAQTCDWVSSCEGKTWTQNKVKLQTKAEGTTADLSVDKGDSVVVFKAWGTCFNELGWDALNVLPSNEKEDILRRLFSPEGDLRFTLGHFSRNWYSCDEVPGDFELKHFNIDRDKTSLVPYIKSAQRYNPNMTFWISPWSPPSWMKINQDYPVRSDKYNTMHPAKDYYLQGNKGPKTEGVFPAELAETDFFIQDHRYLSAYANFFCKFVSAYKELNIPIKMVMFQNESWSYTPYPGCAWTPEGIIRFNVEYLAPALKKAHPDVKLYFGTINTNRYEIIEKVLDDPRMPETIQGIGLQWEGGQLLTRLRAKYPNYNYVQTESECGWGPWGWKQNALIRVDSKQAKAIFTPEYYAVKHYTRFLMPGTKVLAFKPTAEDKKPVLVVQTPEGKNVVVAGNFLDNSQQLTVKLGEKWLNVTLQAHSFNTFEFQVK